MKNYFVCLAACALLVSVAFDGRGGDWIIDFKERLHNPDLELIEGELRPGLIMRGVFAKKDINRGEYVLSYGGFVGSADVKYVNHKDVRTYSLYVPHKGNHYLTAGRFGNGDAAHFIAENQGMYINEASPTWRAVATDGNVTLLDAPGNKPNLCIGTYPFSSLATFLVATSDIKQGDELTWWYGPMYSRHSIMIEADNFVLGDPYNASEPIQGTCKAPFVYIRNLPTISDDDPFLFLYENLTESNLKEEERIRELYSDAHTQLRLFQYLSANNLSSQRLQRLLGNLAGNSSKYGFHLTVF